MFYKFFCLQLFNVKHKIAHLQVVWLQIFVFQKPCLSQTEESSCLWTYGHASLVSDLNSPGKMMPCYLWDINKFLRFPTLCKNILKFGFPVRTFGSTGSTSVLSTLFRPFRQVRYENLWNTSEAWEQESLECLISWWGFVFVLKIGYFPFLNSTFRTEENIQAVREICTVLYYEKKW